MIKVKVCLMLLIVTVGACTGDDYEPPPAVVIVDEADMSGGADSGVVIGGPGGMMGQEVDPLFLRWIEGRVKLAQYDCTCSQGDAWSPVWNKEACAEGWTRYIGGEQTLNCQYNNLFGDQFNKSRFEAYVTCFEVNDAKFNQCIDFSVCTNDGDVIYNCLNEWNRGRNVCTFEHIDVHNLMEGCRAPTDGPNPEFLTYNYWSTAFSSAPNIISPIGLDWPLFDRFDDRCNSSNPCTIMYLRFRPNGLYSSYVMQGIIGNLYAQIDKYLESGVWGMDGARLFFSPDCKGAAVQRSGAMLFQRLFFGNIALERRDSVPDEAQDVRGDISREDACEDELGR
jgi:hypothetical protein